MLLACPPPDLLTGLSARGVVWVGGWAVAAEHRVVCVLVGVCVSRGRYYNREPGSSGARFAMVGGRGASSSCWGGTWRVHWIQPHLTSVHLDRWTAWRTTASDPAARETSIDISVGVQDIADKQDNNTEMGVG